MSVTAKKKPVLVEATRALWVSPFDRKFTAQLLPARHPAYRAFGRRGQEESVKAVGEGPYVALLREEMSSKEENRPGTLITPRKAGISTES
jgi:hypothetical protein